MISRSYGNSPGNIPYYPNRTGSKRTGCCEPLDRKMDIVEKIPNLRKVSITPWADVNVAAESIGKKYVLAAKPNPASVAFG